MEKFFLIFFEVDPNFCLYFSKLICLLILYFVRKIIDLFLHVFDLIVLFCNELNQFADIDILILLT